MPACNINDYKYCLFIGGVQLRNLINLQEKNKNIQNIQY